MKSADDATDTVDRKRIRETRKIRSAFVVFCQERQSTSVDRSDIQAKAHL